MRGMVCGYVVRADTGGSIAGVTVVGTTLEARLAPEADAEAADTEANAGADLATGVARAFDGTPWPYSAHRSDVSAVTDGAGRFLFEQLPQGRWSLRAYGPRGETAGEVRVRVFDDSVNAVTITLAGFAVGAPVTPRGSRRHAKGGRGSGGGGGAMRGATGGVRGRVLHEVYATPVPDAAVTVVRGAGPAPDIAPLTDAEGQFAFDGLAAGEWVLRAHGPGGETGEAIVRVAAGAVVPAAIYVAHGAAWGGAEAG